MRVQVGTEDATGATLVDAAQKDLAICYFGMTRVAKKTHQSHKEHLRAVLDQAGTRSVLPALASTLGFAPPRLSLPAD